jgi:hypothetical protein
MAQACRAIAMSNESSTWTPLEPAAPNSPRVEKEHPLDACSNPRGGRNHEAESKATCASHLLDRLWRESDAGDGCVQI